MCVVSNSAFMFAENTREGANFGYYPQIFPPNAALKCRRKYGEWKEGFQHGRNRNAFSKAKALTKRYNCIWLISRTRNVQ